jgi:hypothetical protein
LSRGGGKQAVKQHTGALGCRFTLDPHDHVVGRSAYDHFEGKGAKRATVGDSEWGERRALATVYTRDRLVRLRRQLRSQHDGVLSKQRLFVANTDSTAARRMVGFRTRLIAAPETARTS